MEPIWHVTRDGVPASPEREGFVHASLGSQLRGTLAAHYADAGEVTLLLLDPAQLGKRLVFEPSRGGQLFPHVYGEIHAADILERVVLRRGADGFDLPGRL